MLPDRVKLRFVMTCLPPCDTAAATWTLVDFATAEFTSLARLAGGFPTETGAAELAELAGDVPVADEDDPGPHAATSSTVATAATGPADHDGNFTASSWLGTEGTVHDAGRGSSG
jgi:hypothetical protein